MATAAEEERSEGSRRWKESRDGGNEEIKGEWLRLQGGDGREPAEERKGGDCGWVSSGEAAEDGGGCCLSCKRKNPEKGGATEMDFLGKRGKANTGDLSPAVAVASIMQGFA